mmetsp:Transcript_59716/g.142080  ORF Transcript_59716/g.142080 Transcript_59716/m.142080 type:complete len:206 (-) Transcript_59716:252-869(-)
MMPLVFLVKSAASSDDGFGHLHGGLRDLHEQDSTVEPGLATSKLREDRRNHLFLCKDHSCILPQAVYPTKPSQKVRQCQICLTDESIAVEIQQPAAALLMLGQQFLHSPSHVPNLVPRNGDVPHRTHNLGRTEAVAVPLGILVVENCGGHPIAATAASAAAKASILLRTSRWIRVAGIHGHYLKRACLGELICNDLRILMLSLLD